jgi:hypothetical protein
MQYFYRQPAILLLGIAGLVLACSKADVAQQAEFKVPNSDMMVSMKIATADDKATVKERIVTATAGDKQLFSASLKDGMNGKAKVKLYKKDAQQYLLVDNNGDRYQLNFRDKQFEKTDKAATALSYVGKFDFDQAKNWNFSKGKQVSGNDNTYSAATENAQRRQFGPPSKNF